MFNQPHPNSILAHATKETRAKISRAQRVSNQDGKSVEAWARNGCMSGVERMTDSGVYEERDDG